MNSSQDSKLKADMPRSLDVIEKARNRPIFTLNLVYYERYVIDEPKWVYSSGCGHVGTGLQGPQAGSLFSARQGQADRRVQGDLARDHQYVGHLRCESSKLTSLLNKKFSLRYFSILFHVPAFKSLK